LQLQFDSRQLYAAKNSLELEPDVHARIVDELLPMSNNSFHDLAGFTGELADRFPFGFGIPRKMAFLVLKLIQKYP
jgi:hypothetical protein